MRGGPRLVVAATAVGAVLVLSGLLLGFAQVGGKYDSESFDCGSPFIATADDGGYGGTEQYDGCERERRHLRWVAGGNALLGLILLGAVASTMRTPHVR